LVTIPDGIVRFSFFVFPFLEEKAMFRTKVLVTGLLALAVVVLAACAQATPQVIEVTKEVVKEVQVEVTKEVVKEVQVVVTPTPAPVVFKAPRPDTFTYVTFGDVDTLDPALAYDTASGHVLINVYEGLIFYNGADAVN
jgi:peptide/nickel transport system substrate-binding protein